MGRRKKVDAEPKKPDKEKPDKPKQEKKDTPQKVEVKSGTLKVKRTAYGGKRVSEKPIEISPFVTTPAQVHVQEATQFVEEGEDGGEYWLTVGVTLPCYIEEMHEAIEVAKNIVDETVQAELGEAEAESDETAKEEPEIEDDEDEGEEDEGGDDDDDEGEESGEEDEGDEGGEDDDDWEDED